MDNKIASFMGRIQSEPVDGAAVCNMYAVGTVENAHRVAALSAYLSSFIRKQPPIILVGEAPGYKGCRLSGIPFTSTGVIHKSEYFKRLGVESLEPAQNEATSSVVWRYLEERGVYPLLWNAYPFHPHLKGVEASNRKPSYTELQKGKSFLLELHAIFPNAILVAVGRVAHHSLKSVGIDTAYVRHPSYGGKTEFIQALDVIMSKVK